MDEVEDTDQRRSISLSDGPIEEIHDGRGV